MRSAGRPERGRPGQAPAPRAGARLLLALGAGACLLALGAAGCAREEPPPGAHPDTRPPQVRQLVPAAEAVVPGFDGEARVRFDEPVQVGGSLERELIASPAYRYRVDAGFRDVRIRPEDGWRDGAVYCFRVPSGLPDLLGNRTAEPIDWCFSTGPPVPATEVTGRLVDRVTGAPVGEGGRVLFHPADSAPADTVPYTAASDGEGNFRLGALPPGAYKALGFLDRNRNLRLDRALEPYDSATFRLRGPEGTAALELGLTEPDTTPPVLAQARAVDSLTVRLELDDPLPRPQPGTRVTVADTATGRTVAVFRWWVGEPADDPAGPPPEAAPAAEDTVGAEGAELVEDTEPAEDRVPVEDTVPAERTVPAEDEDGEEALEVAPPARAGAGAQGLPAPVLTVRLAEPLVPGTYRVRLEGVHNLRGLVGGGEAPFSYPGAGAGGG